MIRFRFLVGITFLWFGVAHAAMPPAPRIQQVEGFIQTKGAATTIRYLQDRDQWEAVLAQISNGGREWIAVAARLAPGSDGSSAEELGIVLAKALPRNPLAVLQVLDTNDDGVIGINSVCDVPFIETTRSFNAAYLRRAIPAVRRIQDPGLVTKRDRCLARLKS